MSKLTKIEIDGKKVPQELLDIIIERIQAMPPHIKLAVLGQVLDQKKIVKEIMEGSEIGKEILAIEIGYYRDLVRD